MPEGVFQTDRAIFDNPIWKNPAKFRLFFFIYGNAVFTENGVDVGGIHVVKGQYLRSYRNLVDDLEYMENNSIKTYSLSHIKKLVDELVKEERLKIETVQLGTLFTVVNYEQYQGFERFKKEDRERRENAERTQRERRENNNNNVNNDKKDKKVLRDIFIPPTLEQVKQYCIERQNNVDAENWHDFYSSKGWMVGKNKMKDWKAAVRTWERNNPQLGKPGGGQSNGLNRSQGVSRTNASQSSKYPIRNSQTP